MLFQYGTIIQILKTTRTTTLPTLILILFKEKTAIKGSFLETQAFFVGCKIKGKW